MKLYETINDILCNILAFCNKVRLCLTIGTYDDIVRPFSLFLQELCAGCTEHQWLLMSYDDVVNDTSIFKNRNEQM